MRTPTYIAAVTLSLLMLPVSGCAGSATGVAPPTHQRTLSFTSDQDFDPGNFDNPTQVHNPYFPMEPGTRLTWRGHALDDDTLVRRMVIFTVTDMTKVVDGVRTVVAWDRDYNDGELGEPELAFFAQDNDGNVWLLGEYPEEYDHGKIVKTPTWIAGLHGARPGIIMQATPRVGTPSYAEGFGGTDVNWTDRAKVDGTGQRTCVPVDCYDDVVVVDEFNPDEPGAHQLKYYAPGVGGVRIGWRGPKEEEQEEMALVELEHLSPEAMANVDATVLEQEHRAYQLSEDVYGVTPPIEPASSPES